MSTLQLSGAGLLSVFSILNICLVLVALVSLQILYQIIHYRVCPILAHYSCTEY